MELGKNENFKQLIPTRAFNINLKIYANKIVNIHRKLSMKQLFNYFIIAV